MSQAQLIPTASTSDSLPPITYKGLPVVTTEMLAKAYGCSVKNIRDNFANNRERFTEGKHFYALTNGEVKAFRDCTESFGAVVPARTRNLTLWLERGAARHAKMLNTDQAWDVFEMLEETFFRVVKPQPTALTASTADDRKPLRSLVHAWAQIAGTSHTALWPQVKAHFQLARIDDLPVEWIPDALAFVQGKIDATGKALPPSYSEQAAQSALSVYNNLALPELFADGISDKEQDKRLKRILRELQTMQEKCGGLFDEIRICLSPKGRRTFLPADLDNTYKTLQHLNFSATAGVYMTRQALISAYHIGKGVEFC